MSSTALSLSKTRAPSTPSKPSTTSEVPPSPGNWRHPRLAEIQRRQNANVFSDRNIRQIIWNVVGLAALHVLSYAVRLATPSQWSTKSSRLYASYAYYAIFLLFLTRIIFSLLPLVRSKDEMNDIPLTASQRQLLGLDPASAPATPGSTFSTPPRYSRTPSLNGSIGGRSNFSSPLSRNGSPAGGSPGLGRMGNGSPFSPAASPLLQKAVAGRRESLDSPSPFGGNVGGDLFGSGPGTPSPAGNKKTSVALNSKWLYDRSRRLSGSPRL